MKRISLYCGVIGLAALQCSCDQKESKGQNNDKEVAKQEATTSFAETRLSALPQAAYLPKDSSIVFGLSNAKGFMDQVVTPMKKVCDGLDTSGLFLSGKCLPEFDSVVVGFPSEITQVSFSDSAAQVKQMEETVADLTSLALRTLLSQVETGNANVFALVKMLQKMNTSPQEIAITLNKLKELNVPVMTSVFSYPENFTVEQIEKIWSRYDELLQEKVNNQAQVECATSSQVEKDGLVWKLVQIDLSQLGKLYAMSVNKQTSSNQALIDALKDFKCTVAYRVDRNQVILSVVTDAQKQLQGKPTLEKSLLANEQFNVVDGIQAQDIYAFAYQSKEYSMAKDNVSESVFAGLVGGVKKGYSAVAQEKSWKNTELVNKALDGIQKIAISWVNDMKSDAGFTATMWKDQGVKVTLKVPNLGLLNDKDKATFGDVMNIKDPIFVCAGGLNPQLKERVIGLVSDTWDIASLTIDDVVNNSPNAQDVQLVNQLKSFKQQEGMVRQVGNMAKNVMNAYGNNFAVVVDGNRTQADIKAMAESPLGFVAPKVALLTDLKNRSELDKEWKQLNAFYGMVGMMFGAPALPTPKVTEASGVSTYSYEFGLPEALNPSVSVSDNSWMLSSPASFGQEVSKMAKPKTDSPYAFYSYYDFKALTNFLKQSNPDAQNKLMIDGIRMTIKPGEHNQAIWEMHFIMPQK